MSAGSSQFAVSARLSANGVNSLLELRGVAGKKKLYANGDLVTKVRNLRGAIQVRILTENSQKLLEEQPALRRLFLDWNLFHVEHRYADLHERLRRTLYQRNAWLRSGGHGKNIWDAEYARLSNSITEFRRRFVENLQAELKLIRYSFPKLPEICVSFRPGWDHARDLMDLLSEVLRDDVRRGFTRYGPFRADLLIHIGGIAGIGSRGQSKLIVALLQYAAQRVCEKKDTAGTCVWLLDDLQAEMDRFSGEQIWRLFERSMHQIFVTSRDYPGRACASDGDRDIALFHVEQGRVAIQQR